MAEDTSGIPGIDPKPRCDIARGMREEHCRLAPTTYLLNNLLIGAKCCCAAARSGAVMC